MEISQDTPLKYDCNIISLLYKYIIHVSINKLYDYRDLVIARIKHCRPGK